MLQSAIREVAGQVVFVHGYARFRLGKLEWVTAHYRSWPKS